MTVEREYEIVLRPEPEGGFSAFVPKLPSVATQGETIEEATEMAKEAIEAYLEGYARMHSRSRPATAAAWLDIVERQPRHIRGQNIVLRYPMSVEPGRPSDAEVFRIAAVGSL